MPARRRFPASFARVGLAAALLAAAPPGRAQAPAEAAAGRSFAFGWSVGVLFPGTMTIGGADFDTGTGFTARLAGDVHLLRRLSVGAYLQLAGTTLREPDADVSMFALGGTVVGHLGDPGAGHLEAGVALGYQLSGIDVQVARDVTGFGVGPLVEYVHPAGGVSMVAHLSFITQLSGGSSEVDVTWGPMLTLALGARFGR